MKKTKLILCVFCFLFLGIFKVAFATTLIGDTVHLYRGYGTNVYEDTDLLVNDTVEFTKFTANGGWHLDFTSNSIDFKSLRDNWRFAEFSPIHEYQFTDLDFNDGSVIVGLDLSKFIWPERVSFKSSSVTLNINGFRDNYWDYGDEWSIGLLTENVLTPEPTTILLFCSGLTVLSGLSMRSNNKTRKSA